MDLIVLKETDVDGNRNILVLIDSFSRGVELWPLKNGDTVPKWKFHCLRTGQMCGVMGCYN
jgi:hypothetical protein